MNMYFKQRKNYYFLFLLILLGRITMPVSATALPDQKTLSNILHQHLTTYPDAENNTYLSDHRTTIHPNCKREDRGIVQQFHRESSPSGLLPTPIADIIAGFARELNGRGFNTTTGRHIHTGYAFAFFFLVKKNGGGSVHCIIDANHVYTNLINAPLDKKESPWREINLADPRAYFYEGKYELFFDKKYDRFGYDDAGFDRAGRFLSEPKKLNTLPIDCNRQKFITLFKQTVKESSIEPGGSSSSDELYD